MIKSKILRSYNHVLQSTVSDCETTSSARFEILLIFINSAQQRSKIYQIPTAIKYPLILINVAHAICGLYFGILWRRICKEKKFCANLVLVAFGFILKCIPFFV